jgi:hypothetical protein
VPLLGGSANVTLHDVVVPEVNENQGACVLLDEDPISMRCAQLVDVFSQTLDGLLAVVPVPLSRIPPQSGTNGTDDSST